MKFKSLILLFFIVLIAVFPVVASAQDVTPEDTAEVASSAPGETTVVVEAEGDYQVKFLEIVGEFLNLIYAMTGISATFLILSLRAWVIDMLNDAVGKRQSDAIQRVVSLVVTEAFNEYSDDLKQFSTAALNKFKAEAQVRGVEISQDAIDFLRQEIADTWAVLKAQI
ncbi:MAG: hypothetical protein HC892_00170 [Saprospiraceae bacterium]|nr:hypothetical protein [Saprospiraceae bacterium]